MLEAHFHGPNNLFSTFTYEEEPHGRTLRRADISATFHRLRTLAGRSLGTRVRFYCCGEYGDQFQRPHYHAAIFGLPRDATDLVDRAWRGLTPSLASGRPGHVDHGYLTADSAAYISGYVTKKLSDAVKFGPQRPDPREEVFAVMSRRPGIGLQALGPLLEALNSSAGAKFIANTGDVPSSFLVGGKVLPLGSHVRGVLRTLLLGTHLRPQLAKDIAERKFHENIQAHLPPLRADSTLDQKLEAWFEASNDAYQVYLSSLRQKSRKVDHRHRINSSRKKL